MDFVEVALGWWEGLALVAFAGVVKLSNGGTRLATLDKSRVLGYLAKVIVVAETTVAKEVIDLRRGEVLEGVGCAGGVTRLHVGRGRIGVHGKEKECFSTDACPRAYGLWVRRGSDGHDEVQGAAEYGQGGRVDPGCLEALAGRP